MKKFALLFVLMALGVFSTYPAFAADARHDAYMKAAKAFVEEHVLPDGEVIEEEEIEMGEDFADNGLAIFDVDGDGQPELLVRFATGSAASNREYVCGFNEKTGKITVKFTGTPGAEYYGNGCIKEYAAHNQGLSGEFWPYAFSRYNPEKDEYDYKGNVDAWSREDFPTNPFEDEKPFPQKTDAVNDGFVYFIDDEDFDGAKGMDTPVDTPVYEKWTKMYIGGAKRIEPEWASADAKGLKTLEKMK